MQKTHFNSQTCPVLPAEIVQNAGPFLGLSVEVLLGATSQENCEITGSAVCEKRMHKGLRSNSKARMVDQMCPNNSVSKTICISVLIFLRIYRCFSRKL